MSPVAQWIKTLACTVLLDTNLDFTARKRSLGQGNIFRSVCQEFCSWGGGIPACLAGLKGEVEGSGLGGVSRPTPGGGYPSMH